jgi:YfiH family protein
LQKNVLKASEWFTSDALGQPADVKAGFFVSKTPVENKTEFLQAAWNAAGFAERRPVFLKQIHSGIIHTFTSGSPPASPPTGDAMVTDSRDFFLVIQVADCLPVLIFDPVKKRVGGAHCGWKGSLLGLAKRTVEKLAGAGSNPKNMRVWFGPSIRSCCYEVDVERSVLFPHHKDKPRNIDLEEFNRRLLLEAGIEGRNLAIDPRCSACGSEKLPSYRREGKAAGRLFAYAALG